MISYFYFTLTLVSTYGAKCCSFVCVLSGFGPEALRHTQHGSSPFDVKIGRSQPNVLSLSALLVFFRVVVFGWVVG